MAIANQGHRRDKNLVDSTNKRIALDNLGGAGITNDLLVIRNNLRNTSHLAFNSVNLTDNEFIFDTDKVLNINSMSAEPTLGGDSTLVTFTTTVPYNTYSGENITISNVNVTGAGSTVFNGDFTTDIVGSGGTFYQYIKTGVSITLTANSSQLTSATSLFKSNVEFIYTKDDVVGVSKTVSVGSTTLEPNADYYICNSDSQTKFKISTTPSTVGLNTISIGSTPDQFDFIRKEPVGRDNILNFIKPEIQDEEEFDYINGLSLNQAFDTTQDNIDSGLFLAEDKYNSTSDTETTRDIKMEGSLQLRSPDGGPSDVTSSDAPGIFIAGTRAFSSENNPWEKVGTAISTSSDKVTASELLFSSGFEVTGMGNDLTTGLSEVDPSTYTHKVAIIVDGETYYLLLKS